MSEAARGHLAMLVFSALVAGSFSLGVRMANMVSPVAFSAARFLLAAAVLGAVALALRAFRPGDGRAPWRYGLLGLCLGLYFWLMFEGLKTAPPVAAAAVFTLTPAMAAVLAWPILRQATSGATALALAVGAAGALVVIFRGDVSAALAMGVGRGEALYFAGCAAHALYTPLVRRLNRGESPLVFSFGVLVAGTLILGVAGARDIAATDWAGLPALVWVTLAYTAVMASAVTFVLLQYAALRLPASKVMAYTYLTPSWVMLWEAAFGGALPSGAVLAGIAVTVLALTMLLGS